MNRRDLVLALGGTAIAWPLGARAQKAMPVIGWLGNSSPSAGSWSVAAFLKGLAEIGAKPGDRVSLVRGPLRATARLRRRSRPTENRPDRDGRRCAFGARSEKRHID